MNKIIRYSLLAILLGVVGSVLSVPEAKAQDVINEILRRMDAHNKKIQSLKADLTMAKFDAGLQQPDKPKIGSTKYLPKSKLTNKMIYARVDWTKPVEEQLSVIGDNFTTYEPRLQRVMKGSKSSKGQGGSKVGSVLSFMTMSRAELKANYTVIYIGEEQIIGGTNTWHLQLTPIGAASYKSADLWVDKDGMPRQSKVTEQNNDTTTLLLTNIEKNIKIDPKIFELTYPKSIKPTKV